MKHSLKLAAVLAAAGSLFVPLNQASAANAGTERPYGETTSATGTFKCLNEDCSEFELEGSGRGVATHLGRFTIEAFERTGVLWTYTMTASDGSTLSGTLDSYGDPSDITCRAGEFANRTYEHFTGGTGRFAGATGSYMSEACILIEGDVYAAEGATITLRYTNEGTISF